MEENFPILLQSFVEFEKLSLLKNLYENGCYLLESVFFVLLLLKICELHVQMGTKVSEPHL